ncbi:MAG: MOSC domain-containing protein [Chloroflexi bacterium]|nr:MOSC domain-containing protein [Chloroflexota bacterium]
MSTLQVQGLWVYPVKSFQGMRVPRWPVEPLGLRFDRRWMLVDPQGRFLSQRRLPAMARLRAYLAYHDAQAGHPRLVLYDAAGEAFEVPMPNPTGPRLRVRVWKDEVEALWVSREADAWLAARLGADVRLVYFPDDAHRPLSPRYGYPGEGTTFTDGYPILLITQGSLDDLNRRLTQPVGAERFRPNVLLGPTEPYAEDTWHRIRIGRVSVRVVKPCTRCVITTLDPRTGQRLGKEPLATLATYRRGRGGVLFGQNAVPEGEGLWEVGQRVTVLRARGAW